MKIDNIIVEIIDTYTNETAPSWAMGLKLSEECGELNENLLFDYEFLKHKDGKSFEGVFGEAADVINVAIGILVTHNPEMTVEEIYNKLASELTRKNEKYKRLLSRQNE